MNEPTTEYQKTIARVIAARHRVEWKPTHVSTSFAVLHIDGVPCGSDLTGDRPEVAGVRGAGGVVWTKRKLPADPRKAAAVLLDRHESVTYEAAQMKERDERSRDRDAKRRALTAAFGDVPGLLVDVHPALAVVSFRAYGLTTEKAARLGDAIRGALAPTRDLQTDPVTDDEGGPW